MVYLAQREGEEHDGVSLCPEPIGAGQYQCVSETCCTGAGAIQWGLVKGVSLGDVAGILEIDVGIIKGRTAIRIFNQFKKLKEQKYWGNHFWTRGYCVDTVGLDEEMIRKYIKYQDDKDEEYPLQRMLLSLRAFQTARVYAG